MPNRPSNQAKRLAFSTGIVLFVALVGFGAQELGRQSVESQLATETTATLESRLAASEARTRELSRRLTASESLIVALKKSERQETVTEKFDATTGRLTERVSAKASSKVTKTTERQRKTETTTAVKDTRTQTITATTVTATTTTATPVARTETGFAGGLLVTPAGLGPAVSFRAFRLGPVGLDATVGAVGPRFSPRAGFLLTGEALPRVTVGVGALAAPAGHEPVGYPLVPGLVDLAPGATLQYRF